MSPPAVNRPWTMAAAAIAAGMAFIDTTALTVALPALRADLHADDASLLWIHNAYAVTLAALLLLGGSLGDRYGIRHTFMAGIAGFGIASAACALAPDTRSLVFLRGLQGVSAAVMIPGSLALIARATPSHALGRAVGLWSAFTLLATALGPVLGGLIVQAGFWRGVFIINVPLAVAAIWITLRHTTPDTPGGSDRLPPDWPSALLLCLGLASVSYALIGRALPYALGLLMFVMFFRRQATAAVPMIPPNLLRCRRLLTATAVSLLVYAAWAGFTYLLPSYLIDTLRIPPARAGLLQLPTLACLAAISPVAGKLLDRRGPRLPLMLGAALCTLGFGSLTWPGFSDYPYAVVAPLTVLGFGLGLCAAPLSATIIGSVPADHQGLAAGINSTAARIASAIGVALLGSVAHRGQSLEFSTLNTCAAALCLLAIPVTLGFPSSRKPASMPEP